MEPVLLSAQLKGASLPSPFALSSSRTSRVPSSLSTLRVRSSASESSSNADSGAGKAATTSPFAGKKISSLLAARRNRTQEPSTAASPPNETKPAEAPLPVATSSSLSPTIASLLKDSFPASSPSTSAVTSASPLLPPPSPFSPPASSSRQSTVNAVPAGTSRAKISFGKRNVIDALKADGGSLKGGSTFKAGYANAPANIFVDEVRSKEQIEAEKFRFEVNQGQILLVVSFFASSIIMMATVYVVWKMGAIHYNEY